MAGGGHSEEPPAASSYWYDACEDGASLLCGIDFAASADFDPGIIPAIDCGADDGFIAEIDRILESINTDPTPPPTPAPAPVALPQLQLQDAAAVVANNAAPVVDTVQSSQSADARKEPRRELLVAVANGGGNLRDRKRQRLAAGGPRHDWRRPLLPPPPSPSRGWEERRGRREYDRSRKRDRDIHTGRDHHRRDTRGFWERDRGGKMVFRHGSWEADPSRESKRARTQDGGATETKKADADRSSSSQKEKPVTEEHARQYQLEVLEQAKSRNTIAFLETGAGKTLIAVLLIKSICDKMLKENKKILAIFLVPKVPLVYQVKWELSVSESQELLMRI
jgi:endoribonuclease Dicer